MASASSSSASVSSVHLAFLKAAVSGDLGLIKRLVAKLEKGGDQEGSFSNIRNSQGHTALHLAAGAGNTQMCKYLIQVLKFDVDVLDTDGDTPLSHASRSGSLQTASYLLDNGASVVKSNNDGLTPLHAAVAFGGGKGMLRLLVSRTGNVDPQSFQGTPLTLASQLGNSEAVAFLLQNNANPNINSYMTPLIMSTKISLACTMLLVKAGADVNANYCGETPLHSAVSTNKVEIISYLLKAGANPNILDEMGLTPLEQAALKRNLEAVTILFPVTSPIPHVQDWSIHGIVKYMSSQKAQETMNVFRNQSFHLFKAKGQDAFRREAYWEAMSWFSMAIYEDKSDAKVFSNRSMCYARLKQRSQALSDAKACIRLKPNWAKGHYREGVAWKLFENYHEAAKSFTRALKLDPENKEIENALREVLEEQIKSMGK